MGIVRTAIEKVTNDREGRQPDMKFSFVDALAEDDVAALRAAAKVDLHCHAFFSTRRENLERRLGHPLQPPPVKMKKLGGSTYMRLIFCPPTWATERSSSSWWSLRCATRSGMALLFWR